MWHQGAPATLISAGLSQQSLFGEAGKANAGGGGVGGGGGGSRRGGCRWTSVWRQVEG